MIKIKKTDREAIQWLFKNMDKSGVVEIPFGCESQYIRRFLASQRCFVYSGLEYMSSGGDPCKDYANILDWITEWTNQLDSIID